jgi:hypothetical protein
MELLIKKNHVGGQMLEIWPMLFPDDLRAKRNLLDSVLRQLS